MVNRRRALVLTAAAAYGIALLIVATWPTHLDRKADVLDTPPAQWIIDQGLAPHRTYALLEFTANVILFVPFGLLVMLWSVRSTWIRTTLVGLAVSGGIELLQAVARPGRTASSNDVIANLLGTAIGAAAVAIWRVAARRGGARGR